MINPLKVATAGYLKQTTKAVLVIAVAGYLNFGGTPPIPPLPPSSSGGGGSSYHNNEKKLSEEKRKRIEKDEQEWMLMLKIFIEQCQ